MRYKDVTSYPVGFEQILPMYPLDFEEYLWANGIQNHTLQYLKSCYDKKEKVSETVQETLCKLFYSYLYGFWHSRSEERRVGKECV